MANIAPIRNKRLSELKIFARKIAQDYGITDPKEVESLVQRVVSSFNLDQPLLHVKRTPKADSMIHRHHVRSAYIDLMAYFIQLKFIENHLITAESNIRDTVALAESELSRLRREFYLQDTDTHIVENFLQNKGKVTTGTIIDNNQLTLAPVSILRADQVQNINLTIFPVESQGEVLHTIQGNKDTIVQSGYGSGIWSATVHTNHIPSIYWDKYWSETYTAPLLIRGIAVLLDVLLEAPMFLNNISANFMTRTRLVRAYLFDEDSENWVPIRAYKGTFLTSESSYELSIHNIQHDIQSQRYRFLLAVEEPTIIGGRRVTKNVNPDFIDLAEALLQQKEIDYQREQYYKYQYSIGIFNFKLREANYLPEGRYISEPYRTEKGALVSVELTKVKEEKASKLYNQNYHVNFIVNNKVTSSIPILPGNQLQVEEILNTNDEWLKPSFYLDPSQSYEVYFLNGVDRVSIKDSLEVYSGLNLLKVNSWVGDPKPRRVLLIYQTTPINSIGYELLDSGNIVDTPPTNQAFTIRRLQPNLSGYRQMSVHKAEPVVRKSITEHFTQEDMEGNSITLRTIPYINYEYFDWSQTNPTEQWLYGYQPIKVWVKLSQNSQAVMAVDRTVWGNRIQRPSLDDFGLNNEVQFYLHKNRLYFNIESPYFVEVQYFTMAEAYQIQIDMSTVDRKYTGIIKEYEVDVHVQ